MIYIITISLDTSTQQQWIPHKVIGLIFATQTLFSHFSGEKTNTIFKIEISVQYTARWKRHFQQFIVDMGANRIISALDYFRAHQDTIRAELYPTLRVNIEQFLNLQNNSFFWNFPTFILYRSRIDEYEIVVMMCCNQKLESLYSYFENHLLRIHRQTPSYAQIYILEGSGQLQAQLNSNFTLTVYLD